MQNDLHIARLHAVFAVFTVAMALIAWDVSAAPVTASAAEQWKAECGSCHVAYPAKLLTAPAWRRLMTGLDRHFGADASIEAASAAAIGAYLEQNAGRERRAPGPSLRITDSVWFQHKHDEVPAAMWKSAKVKSAANCAACHTQAESGDFRERNIRLPR